MDDMSAVKAAVELLHVPSRVRRARQQPLPSGLLPILQIAAGDEVVSTFAAASLDRPPELLVEASRFFIEQILLSPDADSYRVLGVARSATAGELRRNMALLLRGLHPDLDSGTRSIYTARVTAAWENLKTGDRRAAYEKDRRRPRSRHGQRHIKPVRRWIRRPLSQHGSRWRHVLQFIRRLMRPSGA